MSGGCLSVSSRTWKISLTVLSSECLLKMVFNVKYDQGYDIHIRSNKYIAAY